MLAMKRKTIRNHKDFITNRDGPRIADAFFIIKLKPAKFPDDPRYGLIAPKKVFKMAVQRSRAKRIIRDWIAANENLMMPAYDYVFVLREPILYLPRDRGRHKMQLKFKRLKKLYSVNETHNS